MNSQTLTVTRRLSTALRLVILLAKHDARPRVFDVSRRGHVWRVAYQGDNSALFTTLALFSTGFAAGAEGDTNRLEIGV